MPARLDNAGCAKTGEVPGHERLRQTHVGNEFGHGRLALSQATDDAQAVHVGHDLVECTQLAQILRLGDGCGDGAANAGGRRGQGDGSGNGSGDRGHINHDLYQSPLMLGT
jgi:hypothetical protein